MVIPGHNLGNTQVSVNRTIGPTLVIFFRDLEYRFSLDQLKLNAIIFLRIFFLNMLNQR